jgi:cellulose biosynthesis protein BcsQ
MRAADIIMVVLLADAASFATLDAVNGYLSEYCGERDRWPGVHYVANQTDWDKPLTRDVVQVMKRTLGSRTPLWQIHSDMSVQEAFACRQPVTVYNSRSVAARDIRGIAAWLRTLL